jgi:hypothetical protein
MKLVLVVQVQGLWVEGYLSQLTEMGEFGISSEILEGYAEIKFLSLLGLLIAHLIPRGAKNPLLSSHLES